MRVLAEIIASDVSLLVTFNHAIDGVFQNNPKARANFKALSATGQVKEAARESAVEQFSAVRKAEGCESGIALRDHRGDDGPQYLTHLRLSKYESAHDRWLPKNWKV
jgi:hypothetical protein